MVENVEKNATFCSVISPQMTGSENEKDGPNEDVRQDRKQNHVDQKSDQTDH